DSPAAAQESTRRAVDLDVGEAAKVVLADGSTALVKLVGVDVTTDPIRDAVRGAEVRLGIDRAPATIGTSNYPPPTPPGRVQGDSRVVAAYRPNSTEDHWGLVKAARVRLWPAGSPWTAPGSFAYPVPSQAWFASMTQMANEPVYVDGGEVPANKKIYYHSGL